MRIISLSADHSHLGEDGRWVAKDFEESDMHKAESNGTGNEFLDDFPSKKRV